MLLRFNNWEITPINRNLWLHYDERLIIINLKYDIRVRIKLFNDRKICTHWDEQEEKWYFSIVDVVGILTDQSDYQLSRNYWKVLKNRLGKEGNQTVTNCNRLKLLAEDGKMRVTDVADTEQLFRLIQSVPSPKAEPFKQKNEKMMNERNGKW